MNDKNPFALPSGRKLDASLEFAAADPNRAKQSGIEILSIPLNRFIPDPNQPRKLFTDEVLDERRIQLEENGQEQPVTVLPPIEKDGELFYPLVDGECRWRSACLSDKFESLYAQIFRGDPNDLMAIRVAQLLSNDDGSAAITNFERSITYNSLVELAADKDHDFASDAEYVAHTLGKDIADFYRIVKLANVHDDVKTFCLDKGIDDPKVISSMSQIVKVGGVDGFSSVTRDYIVNGLQGKPARKYFSDHARVLKQKKRPASSSVKPAKKEKPVRRLSVKSFRFAKGILEVETPREILKFTVATDLVEDLQDHVPDLK